MTQARLSRIAPTAAIALLLFVLLLAVDLSYGIGTADDPWSLLVFHRVESGDVLYRDVFYGATPLSVWIGAAATKLFGTQLYVLKGLVALCEVATALLAARIARQLDVGRAGQVLVAAASIAYLDLPSPNLYTPLAFVLLLVSMSALLAWRRRAEGPTADAGSMAPLVVAGAAAGLCFASKQNLGLLTIGAVAISLALLSPPRSIDLRGRVAELGVALGAAAVGALIPLIPVALGGALGDLATYGFHKGTYVQYGSISYLDGLRSLAKLAWQPFSQPEALVRFVAFLIPPLAFVALFAKAWRDTRRLTATVALFVAAAVAGVFPRVAFYQLNDAVPACAIAIAWSAKDLTRHLSQAARRAGLVAAAAVIAAAASAPLVGHPAKIALGDYAASDLPHFAGVVVPVGYSERVARLAAQLREADRGSNRTFTLMPSASIFYLLSGISDPTRFDNPVVTTFGASGQEEVIGQIRSAEIRRVCVGSFGFRPDEPEPEHEATTFRGYQPRTLISYVRGRMARVRELGSRSDVAPLAHCTLYRARD